MVRIVHPSLFFSLLCSLLMRLPTLVSPYRLPAHFRPAASVFTLRICAPDQPADVGMRISLRLSGEEAGGEREMRRAAGRPRGDKGKQFFESEVRRLFSPPIAADRLSTVRQGAHQGAPAGRLPRTGGPVVALRGGPAVPVLGSWKVMLFRRVQAKPTCGIKHMSR